MTADEDLYTVLTSYAGLQALVGNGDSPETFRIYPVVMPQEESDKPAITYQRITGARINTMSDAGGSGVQNILYQITSWSRTHKEAHAVIEQVRLALFNNTTFQTVPINNRDNYESQTKLYSVEYDFSVWHR